MQAAACRLCPPQTDQFLHLAHPLRIFPCTDLIPGHAPAAVRVKTALHGDLRPIIDARASRKCKEHGQLLVKNIQVMEAVHQPFRIVGIQKVEQHIIILLHIHRITAVDHVFKLLLIHGAVEKIVMDPAHERIIHDRVILIPHQPLAGVMPDFPEKINVRLDCL